MDTTNAPPPPPRLPSKPCPSDQPVPSPHSDGHRSRSPSLRMPARHPHFSPRSCAHMLYKELCAHPTGPQRSAQHRLRASIRLLRLAVSSLLQRSMRAQPTGEANRSPSHDPDPVPYEHQEAGVAERAYLWEYPPAYTPPSRLLDNLRPAIRFLRHCLAGGAYFSLSGPAISGSDLAMLFHVLCVGIGFAPQNWPNHSAQKA